MLPYCRGATTATRRGFLCESEPAVLTPGRHQTGRQAEKHSAAFDRPRAAGEALRWQANANGPEPKPGGRWRCLLNSGGWLPARWPRDARHAVLADERDGIDVPAVLAPLARATNRRRRTRN